MKIIGTVLLVLIPGILSSTNDDDFEQELRSLCDKNGGPKAYESTQNSIANVKNTIVPTVTEILQEYQNSSEGIDSAIRLYCDKVQILDNSINEFMQAVTLCLEPDDQEMPIIRNFTASLLQYPYANINLVKAIFNSTDKNCFTSKLGSVVNCTEDVLGTRNTTIANISSSEIDSDETIILPQHESPTRNETCSNIQTLEQCTVRVLAECEDQVFSTTLNSMYKYINNDLPCENLPKSPK